MIKQKLKDFVVKDLGVPPLMFVNHYHSIKRYFRKGNLLDVGCGKGFASRYFNYKGFVCVGLDNDINFVNEANKLKGVSALNLDVENDNIAGSFDVIYLSHSLEHLINPVLFLFKIRNNLSSGGIVFVEVPNCFNTVTRELSNKIVEHNNHFTPFTLANLFVCCGFEILDMAVFKDVSPGLFCSFFLADLGINSYKRLSYADGNKIIIIARKKDD